MECQDDQGPCGLFVTGNRRVNLGLGQDSECELLSSPQKVNCLILRTDRDLKEYIHQISSSMSSTRDCVDLLQEREPYLAQ